MSSIVDTLFGGTDKTSLKQQKRDNAVIRDYVREMQGQSRDDIMSLWPGVSDNRNMGYQAALDIFGQSMPQQASLFQQGNVGAQNMLLSGLNPYTQAILGQPIDMSGMQPMQFQYDPSFMQQQLPQFTQPSQLLGGQDPAASTQASPQSTQQAIQEYLANMHRTGV